MKVSGLQELTRPCGTGRIELECVPDSVSMIQRHRPEARCRSVLATCHTANGSSERLSLQSRFEGSVPFGWQPFTEGTRCVGGTPEPKGMITCRTVGIEVALGSPFGICLPCCSQRSACGLPVCVSSVRGPLPGFFRRHACLNTLDVDSLDRCRAR